MQPQLEGTEFGILPVGNLGSRWSPCPRCRIGTDCEHIHMGMDTTEMVCFVCNHTYVYTYLCPHRHVCTHPNVFFIAVHICVHTHVPCPPALLVWSLNPGTPVWLAGTVSLGSVPSPQFFLLYTGKHEGLLGTHPDWWGLLMTLFQNPCVGECLPGLSAWLSA